MPSRIPARLATLLLLAGLALAALCYVAVALTLRHEAACSGDAASIAQCVAGATFWREVAMAGFVTALCIGIVGLVLDRLRRWIR